MMAYFRVLLPCVLAKHSNVANTPPRGWTSHSAFGSLVDQQKLTSVIAALQLKRTSGQSLQSLGYGRLVLDDWYASNAPCPPAVQPGAFHDAGGNPLVDIMRLPDLARWVGAAQAANFNVSFSVNACEPGLNDVQAALDLAGDVKLTTQLFDGVSVAPCGPNQNMSAWGEALGGGGGLLPDSGPPLLLSYARPAIGDVDARLRYPFWSTTGDPSTPLLGGWVAGAVLQCPAHMWYYNGQGSISDWASAIEAISNVTSATPRVLGSSATGDSHPMSTEECWASPGDLPFGAMASMEEERSVFGLWVITSAPLLLSFDVTGERVYLC
jgi:hypothetical protein